MKFNQGSLLTAVIAFGLVLTAALMFVSFHYLVDVQQDAFDEQSSHLADKLASELEDVRDEIRGLATVFYALDRIDADTLRANSGHTFLQHHPVSKIVFAQLVTDKQRQSFEATKREEGFISFAIREYGDRQVAAAQRPSYLPVTHVEPFDVDNVGLLGIDLTGTGSFRDTIAQAIKSGDDIGLVGALGDGSSGLWLFKAIYAGFAGRSDPYFATHSQEWSMV